MTEAAAPRAFGFTLFYRPVGAGLLDPNDPPDDRPVDRLPSCQYSTKATEAERERALLEECPRLEAQGYRIERVVRESFCVRCQGAGSIAVKPKGWRKKTPPPPYAMRRQVCQDCGGGGAEHQIQSVWTLGAAGTVEAS